MFRVSLIVLIVFVSHLMSFGQSVKEIVAKGDKCYDKKMYTCALDNYLKALDINPDDASVNLKVGQTYLYSETKSKAAKFISKAYRLNPEINEHIDYYLGVSFQNTNEFKKAIEHFQELINKKTKLASLAPKWIQECRIADSLSNYELNVIIENLGPGINTPLLDYSPIISSDDNTLIFTSNRSSDPEDDYADDNYEDVYITKRTGSKWTAPKMISRNINHEESDAASSLSPDGKILFLYYGDNNGDIYTSKLMGSEWGQPQPLNENINTPYWETGASITADGKRLYFASDKPGGIGALDIYFCDLDAKGNWGKAVNAGTWINTEENEDAPFIHPFGTTLYFSSDGHPTLGNSDIFVSEMVAGKFRRPENLGWPINTWEYDGFFTVSLDKKHGYFSTFKEGGQGQADIYSVTFLEPKYKPKPVKVVEKTKTVKPKVADYFDPIIQQSKDKKIVTLLKGKIIDENTAEPLAAIISLIDNETQKVISRISTDSITGDFELVIPHGGNYGVNTEKVGYLFNSINFNVPIFAEYQEIDTHIIMVRAEVGSKMILKNVFFNVGNSELKNESIAEIEKIGNLIRTNPTLSVRINGHTDNTGNTVNNKTLSLNRASSVVNYLLSKGIDSGRLSATGYGSEHPIVSNDDELGGRELNRRTEIEIIGAN